MSNIIIASKSNYYKRDASFSELLTLKITTNNIFCVFICLFTFLMRKYIFRAPSRQEDKGASEVIYDAVKVSRFGYLFLKKPNW